MSTLATYQLFLGRAIPAGGVPEAGYACIDYVEDVHLEAWQRHVLNLYLDGYTIQTAKGFWHGVSEDTYVLTVVCHESDARYLAASYCRWFAQEAVGIVALPLMEFVDRGDHSPRPGRVQKPFT